MKTGKGAGVAFWDKEYKNSVKKGHGGRNGNARGGRRSGPQKGEHLALSANPSEDLILFTRFVERHFGRTFLNPVASVVDLGCGNGRNLVYLCENFGMRGVGYDISREAISIAKKASVDMPLSYEVRSIADKLPLADASQTFALDMMTSHFLNNVERESLLSEIVRVLRPDGFLFLKTFLRDEDEHAERLLKESPAAEAGSYIHPKIGLAEHVFTENEIIDALEKNFYIHKIVKSHRHHGRDGKAGKRRSISIYAQKNI